MTAPSLAQSPSSIYYTEASGALSTEVSSFMAMYKTLKTTGQPHAGAAGFLYTDPQANTPLFDAILASQRTVSGTLNFDEACPVATPVQIALHAGNGTISNDLTDTEATINHLDAALGAEGVTVSVEGDQLVSQGMPPEPVSGTPIPAQAFVPTPERAAWIADIEWHTLQTTATQNPAEDVANTLLGLPTNAQQLAWSIWDHLFDTQHDEPDEIRVLKAEFGIYGALPVLEVTFDQGFFLIDGLTGEAFGPYSDGQPYDPIPLLSNHPEYQAGTPASLIVAETGCEAVGGRKRWRPNPPPNYTPKAPVLVPCPTPQDPNRMCPTAPVPYVPPNPPLEWPRPFFEYPLDVDHLRPPYRIPDVPRAPWRTNPGLPGNPTDWSCETLDGFWGPVYLCAAITEVCDASGSNCIKRVIICAFSSYPEDEPNPPRHQRPPAPGEWPQWPDPIEFDEPNSTNPTNPNNCTDRYYY